MAIQWILMSFVTGVKKIPTACITIEDAEMMTRMAARGTKIIVNLKMEAQNLPQVVSRNTVAEIEGSVHPEQVSAFHGAHFFLNGYQGPVGQRVLNTIQRIIHYPVDER